MRFRTPGVSMTNDNLLRPRWATKHTQPSKMDAVILPMGVVVVIIIHKHEC